MSEEKSSCAVCLVDTKKKQYEIATQCSECSSISVPDQLMRNTECTSCPRDVINAKSRENMKFLIVEGEPKCEDCALQSNFQKQIKMKGMKEENEEQLPENYQYFCVQCKKITEWKNNGDKTSQCTICEIQGTNTK